MTDPVTLAIAAAVASGAVTKITEAATEGTVATFKALCRALFTRFRSTPGAQEALDEARLEPEDTKALAAVAAHLERAAEEDPEIARLLGELRSQGNPEGGGSVNNQIFGSVGDTAKVIQGRDFNGPINL